MLVPGNTLKAMAGPADHLEGAVEPLSDGRAAFHPIAGIDVGDAGTLRDGRIDEIGSPAELAASGGIYAQSAAKALQENTELPPAEVVKKALTIAGELCIYTNLSHIIETLE